jgi:hypothetical protein
MKKADKLNRVLRKFYSKPVISNLDTEVGLVSLDFLYILKIGQRSRCANSLYEFQELRLDLCFMPNSIKVLAEWDRGQA